MQHNKKQSRLIKRGLLVRTRGFALVEVLIASAIITLVTFVLVSAGQKGLSLSERALGQTQASYLLEEGAEAVKSIRDDGWVTISSQSIDTPLYLSYNTGSNQWSLSSTATTVDNTFTRTVTFSNVNRDGNDDIAETGTTDDGARKVTANVSWTSSGGSTSRSIEFYIFDIFE